MLKRNAAGRTVTRIDLAEAVYRASGSSRSEAAGFVDETLTEILDAIVRGENVKLSRFGAFLVRNKRQRIGRNPKTKVEAVVSARRVVVFKASPLLTDAVNNRGPESVEPPDPRPSACHEPRRQSGREPVRRAATRPGT
jgi:integration host factor subunit alpha